MGKGVDGDGSVRVDSVDGAWTPNRSRTWGNDIVETKNRGQSWAWTWEVRNRWTSACRSTKRVSRHAIQRVERTFRGASNTTWTFRHRHLWPLLVRVFSAKKQWFALILFLCCAAVPMVILGWFTPKPERAPGTWPPYYNIFATKYMGCDNYIDDRPANSTITGIEGLFVLDKAWGRLSFSTVKTIDVAWDILIGRGVQLLAWWAAYIVFSDALLRVIERHPASFRIFQRIALEGPSLLSLWTLCRELWSVRSKRTKALFTYILLSTSYVLCIPMFLGAMTGYDSTSIAWMDLDNSNNIVPVTAVKYSWAIFGTQNSTFDKPVCASPGDVSIQDDYYRLRLEQCTCQLSNGTLAPPGTFTYAGDKRFYFNMNLLNRNQFSCTFNYPGSSGSWKGEVYDSADSTYKPNTSYCNETVNYRVNDHDYQIQTLNATYTLCYDGKVYSVLELVGKSRCLPDTANPSYQWGFSTMLSGIFVFIHFAWCVSMYILWLDAQSGSTLIHEGYEMTPLRAAFAIAKAVKNKTGLGEKQLVRRDTKDLNKELYGVGKEAGATIHYDIFVKEAEEEVLGKGSMRRRKAFDIDALPS